MTWRDLKRRVEEDGWFQIRQRGSHRVYVHPTKPNKITLAWHSLSEEVGRGTEHAILKDAGLK